MPRIAKAYIALVMASGAAVLLIATVSWSSNSIREFTIFLGLAALASTLKVRIPGLDGTMSPNFIFLLIGMTCFSFSEVVACAFLAAIVQSVWRPKQKLRIVQIGFSTACLVTCSAAAFLTSHMLGRAGNVTSPAALVIAAGSLYLALNTVLVSTVISLAESRSLKQVWQLCHEWIFPNFLGGIVLAGVVSGPFTRFSVWKEFLLLLPTIVIAYSYLVLRTRQRLTN
jgi:hypothetical protein